MELWYTEHHTKNVKLSIRFDKQLHTEQSEFQRIDVFETPEFGRVLTLDGYLMLTEKDEFIYHEMMVHVPLAVHPHPQRVLVIGGGDGGVLRELCKYDDVEHIDICEIDGRVIEVCKRYLKQTACGFDDPRVHVHVGDGLKYVRKCTDEYDVIIVDSTDPFGPGEELFTKEFYGNCYKALHADGIMVNQHESPYYEADARAMVRAHQRIVKSFGLSRLYQVFIPTYPSGHWLFGFASKKYHPVHDLDADRWNARHIVTHYYNTNLHRGSFWLPNYVQERLMHVEPDEED